MLPLFSPPPESDFDRRTAAKSLALGLLTAISIGLVLVLGRNTPSVPLIVFAFIAVISAIAVAVALVSPKLPSSEKSKRGLDGLDMYSLIDRLVEEIDDDEAAYLQRRLDDREHKDQRDVSASIEQLLDKRAEEKRL